MLLAIIQLQQSRNLLMEEEVVQMDALEGTCRHQEDSLSNRPPKNVLIDPLALLSKVGFPLSSELYIVKGLCDKILDSVQLLLQGYDLMMLGKGAFFLVSLLHIGAGSNRLDLDMYLRRPSFSERPRLVWVFRLDTDSILAVLLGSKRVATLFRADLVGREDVTLIH